LRPLFKISLVLLVAAAMVGCANSKMETVAADPPPAPVKTGVPADHPDMTEQETYIPCSECHREETPDVVDQWWNSGHGIATVKCYQCHGTFEEMMLVPAEDTCMVCHEEQMTKLNDSMTCWQCHPAHGFTGHPSERGEG